jgi:hypothetical protein
MPLESQTNKVLLDKKMSQIGEALRSGKPTEAMSIAARLHEEANSDDSLVVCLRTALVAKSVHGESLLTDDLYRKSQELASSRIFNPEMTSLGVSSKILMGEAVNDDDIKSVARAFRMSPRITRGLMGMAFGLVDEPTRKRIMEVIS